MWWHQLLFQPNDVSCEPPGVLAVSSDGLAPSVWRGASVQLRLLQQENLYCGCSSCNLVPHVPPLLTGSVSKAHVGVLLLFKGIPCCSVTPCCLPTCLCSLPPASLHRPSLPHLPPHPPHLRLCIQHGSQGAQVPSGLDPRAVLQHTAVSLRQNLNYTNKRSRLPTSLPSPLSPASICLPLPSLSLTGSPSCSLHLSVPSLFTP